MAKSAISYICQTCGTAHPRWQGKCEGCGAWNTLVQEIAAQDVPKSMGTRKKGRSLELVDLSAKSAAPYPRITSGIEEFDRVTGGGLVPGSAILIGGDPGIGKSTLLLQAVCALARKGTPCLYVSGEESIEQIRGRAARLGLTDSPVRLASAANVRDILTTLQDREEGFAIAVIDSIQTMFVDTIEAAPGTVSQVRGASQELIRAAKTSDVVVIFVGHVTKDGQIAGPRVLEHMVDTVLYFEGERSYQFRILRAVKNRFGPTDEIGVFEMAHEGLVEVSNPSALFLSQRRENMAGSAVLAALEGTRPVLVEVQALVAPSNLSAPRRAVIGWDPQRLAMIAAVLERSCGVSLLGQDIFLNMAGGIRVGEPAADLAIAAALMSAHRTIPLPPDTVFFGEVGLAGEIRQVAQVDLRLREAAKLGFTRALIPLLKKTSDALGDLITLHEVSTLQDLADFVG